MRDAMRNAMVAQCRYRVFHAGFPTTRPSVFSELKIMKIVISIYQIIQEKFAYRELFTCW